MLGISPQNTSQRGFEKYQRGSSAGRDGNKESYDIFKITNHLLCIYRCTGPISKDCVMCSTTVWAPKSCYFGSRFSVFASWFPWPPHTWQTGGHRGGASVPTIENIVRLTSSHGLFRLFHPRTFSRYLAWWARENMSHNLQDDPPFDSKTGVQLPSECCWQLSRFIIHVPATSPDL